MKKNAATSTFCCHTTRNDALALMSKVSPPKSNHACGKYATMMARGILQDVSLEFWVRVACLIFNSSWSDVTLWTEDQSQTKSTGKLIRLWGSLNGRGQSQSNIPPLAIILETDDGKWQTAHGCLDLGDGVKINSSNEYKAK